MTAPESLRLALFFSRLAVKRSIAPNLHVDPLVAECFLTENCNLRCISCNCWRETTRHELTTAEWKDVISQLAELRILKVNFTGGEPLVRKDAIELMRHATAAGIRHLHLNTNAILLRPEKLDAVLDAGVRSFNISVDGATSEIHDHVRGRSGAFETTIQHLRLVLARRDELQLKVRMNFTVMRDNVANLPAIARLAQELGVRLYLNLATDQTFLFRADEVTTQKQVDSGALVEALKELERIKRASSRSLPRFSDLRYMRGHFSDVVQRDVPCAESQLKLMVHSTGQIGGCWGHDPVFNVRNRRIAEVLASQHYREEHARFFRKDCVGCGSNYSLNLRWLPVTYVRDVAWRLGMTSLARD